MAQKQPDHEAYDCDLEWLLVAGDAALGERGTLAATIAVLEIGGSGEGGVPNTDPYTDHQVGWGPMSVGYVERHRWLTDAWRRLTQHERGVLAACYSAPNADARSDEGFGARDRWVDGEHCRGSHRPTHAGAQAQLGRYAALAFALTDDPAALLIACQQPGKGTAGRQIREALKGARSEAIAAHKAWGLAKRAAQEPRHWSERKAIMPVYSRTQAESLEALEYEREQRERDREPDEFLAKQTQRTPNLDAYNRGKR